MIPTPLRLDLREGDDPYGCIFFFNGWKTRSMDLGPPSPDALCRLPSRQGGSGRSADGRAGETQRGSAAVDHAMGGAGGRWPKMSSIVIIIRAVAAAGAVTVAVVAAVTVAGAGSSSISSPF